MYYGITIILKTCGTLAGAIFLNLATVDHIQYTLDGLQESFHRLRKIEWKSQSSRMWYHRFVKSYFCCRSCMFVGGTDNEKDGHTPCRHRNRHYVKESRRRRKCIRQFPPCLPAYGRACIYTLDWHVGNSHIAIFWYVESVDGVAEAFALLGCLKAHVSVVQKRKQVLNWSSTSRRAHLEPRLVIIGFLTDQTL